MKLRAVDGCIAPGQLFKLIVTGYAIGVMALFSPIYILLSIFALLGSATGVDPWPILLGPVILPVVAVLQGLMIGGLVVLGLKIYRSKRRIEIR